MTVLGKLLFFVTLMTNLSLIHDISYQLCQTQASEDPERHFNCKVVDSGVSHRYGLGILSFSSTGTILDIPMGQCHFMIHSPLS